jgi:hypothetical protein
MRHYEMVEVPARKVRNHVKTTCDLCGATAKKGCWDSAEWETDKTNLDVRVTHYRQNDYGNSADVEKMMVDLCPKCFENKLVPWLREQGAEIEYKDAGY